MVALIRSPYFDPWTRRLFGEGGMEGNLHPKLEPPVQIGGVSGGVIMSKLGNETAKYAENHPLWTHLLTFIEGQRSAVLHGSYCEFRPLWWRDSSFKGLIRHTMTLRYPEVGAPSSLWNWPETKIKASNGGRTWSTELILPPECKAIPMWRMCRWIPSTATEISTPSKLHTYFATIFYLLGFNRPRPGDLLHFGTRFNLESLLSFHHTKSS